MDRKQSSRRVGGCGRKGGHRRGADVTPASEVSPGLANFGKGSVIDRGAGSAFRFLL